MSKKKSPSQKPLTRQQRFVAAADRGDLAAQIAVAREEAIAMLAISGIDAENELDHVEALAGDLKAVDWDARCNQLKAAYALGIAVGRLVHPDAFGGDTMTGRSYANGVPDHTWKCDQTGGAK